MASEDMMWVYLIFFMIPLARIVPRLYRKWKNKNNSINPSQINPNFQRIEQTQQPFENSGEFRKSDFIPVSESFEKSEKFEKPQSIEMQVLGVINKGADDFDQIQKNTGIDNQKLENVLEKMEKDSLMKVIKKDGVLGSKIKLYLTEKGFEKYNKSE